MCARAFRPALHVTGFRAYVRTCSLLRTQELRPALALGLAITTQLRSGARSTVPRLHGRVQEPARRHTRTGTRVERTRARSPHQCACASSLPPPGSGVRPAAPAPAQGEAHKRAHAHDRQRTACHKHGPATFSMLSRFHTFHDLCCKMLSFPNDISARCRPECRSTRCALRACLRPCRACEHPNTVCPGVHIKSTEREHQTRNTGSRAGVRVASTAAGGNLNLKVGAALSLIRLAADGRPRPTLSECQCA